MIRLPFIMGVVFCVLQTRVLYYEAFGVKGTIEFLEGLRGS